MIERIKQNFLLYKSIYNNTLPKLDNDSRILLENSLYLSVFTTFEKFLKIMINSYNTDIVNKGIKFTELSIGIAKGMFKNDEKRIMHIFESKNDDSFLSYYNKITSNIQREELEKYIHFEFLHKDKLENYYLDLFDQILGDKNILQKIEIKKEDFGGLITIDSDASSFICEYTDKVRNSIAHENNSFRISNYESFDKVADTFLLIINRINEEYKKHNGFEIKDYDINVLDDFL